MPKPRGKKGKPLRPVLHIFCEGLKTEPNYIKGYIDEFHPGIRRLNVIVIEPTRKNTPVQLVEEAVEKKKDPATPKNDLFWVVYDREAEAKYSKDFHQKAHQKAKAQGIDVALSNVCFEIWILLHFVGSSSCYSSFDDLMSNSPLKKELSKKGVKSYQKGESSIFDYLKNNVSDARRRAEAMNSESRLCCQVPNSPPYLLNPYTDMHLLLDAIDEFVLDHCGKK